MNFLPSWKYQMDSMKWPLIIFYIVIAALIILMGVSMTIVSNEGNQFNVGGIEMSSIIFIFVCGLNSFKGSFHMLNANGISRKTMFVSFVAVICAVAAGMALIDSAIGVTLKGFGNYEPGFMQIYGIETYSAQSVLIGLLWMFCTNLFAGMAGYLITTLYYRMSKPIKLLVSIGVPVTLFIVWPIVDWVLFRNAVSSTFYRFVGWAFGFSSGNPFMGVISSILFAILLGALSFWVIRRVPVKARQQ